MMVRSAAKIAVAPTGATVPRARVLRRLSGARAAAHAMGANIDAMLAQLKLQLGEAVLLMKEILALMPDGDMGLRTLKGKLAHAVGAIGLFG